MLQNTPVALYCGPSDRPIRHDILLWSNRRRRFLYDGNVGNHYHGEMPGYRGKQLLCDKAYVAALWCKLLGHCELQQCSCCQASAAK